ncbi:hypothetical protein ACH5A2_02630 [Streptomyces collinus]|uniref:hypothetical protein n=1 Tax=Streptomyces collinus TaxID=42684 RepID=UPI003794C48C
MREGRYRLGRAPSRPRAVPLDQSPAGTPLADAAAPEIRDGRIALRLRPFEVVTLRLRRA